MEDLKQWTGDMLVCNKYRLAKTNGEFDVNHKDLLRKGAKITKDYYEQINANTEDSGVIYVIDKKATDKYYVDAKKQYEDRKARKNVGAKAAQNLADALQGIQAVQPTVETAPAPAKEEPKTEEKPKEIIVPEGNPTIEWDQPQVLGWLENQKDKDGNPLTFKRTLGIKRLLAEVVTPFLESLNDTESKEEEE